MGERFAETQGTTLGRLAADYQLAEDVNAAKKLSLPERTRGTIEIDLRDFEINGQTIDRFECDVAVNSERIVFKDVRVERNKASAFEPEATWSTA